VLEEFVTSHRVQEIPAFYTEHLAVVELLSRLGLMDSVRSANIRWNVQNRGFQVSPALLCLPSAGFFTHLQFVGPLHRANYLNPLLYPPHPRQSNSEVMIPKH